MPGELVWFTRPRMPGVLATIATWHTDLRLLAWVDDPTHHVCLTVVERVAGLLGGEAQVLVVSTMGLVGSGWATSPCPVPLWTLMHPGDLVVVGSSGCVVWTTEPDSDDWASFNADRGAFAQVIARRTNANDDDDVAVIICGAFGWIINVFDVLNGVGRLLP